MLKRPLITFVLGVILGTVVIGFLWFSSILAEGFSSWGQAEVFFDQEAISHLKESRVCPHPTATNVFYFIDGFQDHRIFAAFTDSPDAIDATVIKLTGKPIADLPKWANQIEEDWQRHPGKTEAKFPTSLYDIRKIKRARFYQSPPASNVWHIIVDEESNRLYYGSWET